jgi:hypothetical protein
MRSLARYLLAALFSIAVSAAHAQSVPKRNFPASKACIQSPLLLPIEAQVGPWTVAYGTKSLTRAWLNGKFADVVAASGTVTIRFINGCPDLDTLAGLMSISPNTGYGALPLSKWYDQSGNGNDCTQVANANRPVVMLANGKVYVAGDGVQIAFITSSNGDKFCNIPATASFSGQALSAYFVWQNNSSIAANYGASGTLLTTSSACASGGISVDYGSAENPGINFYYTDWGSFGNHYTTLFPETQPTVVGFVGGAGSASITQDEEASSALTAATAGTVTGGTVGNIPCRSLNAGYFGRLQAVMVAGATAFSSAQQTTMRNALYKWANIILPTTSNIELLVDGPSLDDATGAYVGTVMAQGWVEDLTALLPPMRFGNTSKFGITTEAQTSAWSGNQSTFFDGRYRKHILVASDLAIQNAMVGGDTAAQACTALSNYLAAAKIGVSWSLILVPLVPPYATSGFAARFASYNTMVLANSCGNTGTTTVDFRNDPILGINQPASDPVYYNETGPGADHPTQIGYYGYVGYYYSAIMSYLGQ